MPMNIEDKLLRRSSVNKSPAGALARELLEAASLRKGKAVYLLNTHMAVESRSNPALRTALDEAEVLVADGRPISVLASLVGNTDVPHVTGYDLLTRLLQEPTVVGKRIMAVGGSDSEQAAARKALQDMHALCVPEFVSTSFVTDPTKIPADIIESIRSFGPDVVLVFLGCPKQEILIHHLKKVYPAIYIGLGGALQLVGGVKMRAPEILRTLCLEWLFRLAQDPVRLWKRYATTVPLFLLYFAMRKFG